MHINNELLCLGWTPTNFVKILMPPLFLMDWWVILYNLKKKLSLKPLTRNHNMLNLTMSLFI